MSPDGLQVERTSLAWSRTALALLADAGLLLLRDPVGRLGLVLAAAAIALAGVVAAVARHRVRTLAREPGASPRGLVTAVGGAVAALSVAVGCAVLVR